MQDVEKIDILGEDSGSFGVKVLCIILEYSSQNVLTGTSACDTLGSPLLRPNLDLIGALVRQSVVMRTLISVRGRLE
jgi:hypothetical protein